MIHGIWALAVATAFGAGYLASTPAATDSHPQGGTSARQTSSDQGAGDFTASGEGSNTPGRHDAAVLSGAQVKERIFYALSKADRIERMRMLCDLLPSVTKENWREVEDAFARQQSKEFRIAGWERELMLERLGQVRGAEAVEEALATGDRSRKGKTATLLRGWAGADPKQAAEWFDAQAPDLQKAMLGDFVTGLALGDPKRAMEVIQRFSTADHVSFVPLIVYNTVQREGFGGAEQAFSSQLAKGGIGGDIFLALTARRMEVAKLLGEPVNNLDWLDGYLRTDSPAGPHAAELIIGDAAQRDAVSVAKWLDDRDSRLNPPQQKAAYLAVARALVNASPDQFADWMKQHSNHPQYGAMVQATADDLARKGKADEAQRLIGNVQEEALRIKLQTSFEQQKWQSGAEGVRLESKAGFIHSPFDAQQRPIDVRGLPKGSQIEDPYRPGKTLLVP